MPQPVLTAMEPSLATQNSGDILLVVKGGGFTIGSTVYFNEAPLRTTYKSMQMLEANLPKGFLSRVGTYSVYVTNPEPLPPLENAGRTAKLWFMVKF